MIVDEPTNADLDRRLAELLEPEPVYVHDAERTLAAQMDGSPILSPKGAWECRCVYDDGDEPRWLPRPFKTDIVAAWELVTSMKENGYDFQLRWFGFDWHCCFARDPFVPSVWAKTAPLVISLAAEKALTKQVGQRW